MQNTLSNFFHVSHNLLEYKYWKLCMSKMLYFFSCGILACIEIERVRGWVLIKCMVPTCLNHLAPGGPTFQTLK